MPAADSLPPAFRASDADREAIIRVLRDGATEGRLTHDTFLHRLGIALHARRVEELSALLGDLPTPAGKPASGSRALLTRAVSWWSSLTAELGNAWRAPRQAKLVLPRADQASLTIGRSPDCDLTLPDRTVSWLHAELRHSGNGWILADTSSKNGTRVNGWRVVRGHAVRPGDCVTFGRTALRVVE